MARLIKVRMWNGIGNCYHYDAMAMECLLQQNAGITDHVGGYNSCFEQYTGLKDKNGKEIYEGDIVSIKYGDNGKAKVEADMFALRADQERFGGTHEIIGNIHEDKELLNE